VRRYGSVADHAARMVGMLMLHARVDQPAYGVENVVHLDMHCFLGTLSSPDTVMAITPLRPVMAGMSCCGLSIAWGPSATTR